MAEFCFDTSAFINSWNFHYRLPVFEGVWTALAGALNDGIVCGPSEVFEEVAVRAGDDLHNWLVDHKDSFIPPAQTWPAHLVTVQQHAPHWFMGTGEHSADPFVVALAMDQQLPVVTYEGIAFSGDAAKVGTYRRSILHVCSLCGVQTVTMFDVLSHLGVVLVR
jgi:hypothetical protein